MADCNNKFKWTIVEYNPQKENADFPNSFWRIWKDDIPDEVQLINPYIDQVIFVKILKLPHYMCLRDGCQRLKETYGLYAGGWLRLCYMGHGQFMIQVLNRNCQEITSPFNGQPPNVAITSNLVKYPSLYLECDSECWGTHVPNMFKNEYGHELSHTATLIENKSNTFPVVVRDIVDDKYFTLGWDIVKEFYELSFGGWVQSLYIGGCQFLIAVYNRDLNMVDPPDCNVRFPHPLPYLLLPNPIPHPEDLDEPDKDIFAIYYDKYLTKFQSKNFFVLPEIWAAEALPSKPESVLLQSENGEVYQVRIKWSARRSWEARLTDGWIDFLAENEITYDVVLRFGMPEPNSEIAIVCVFSD